MRIVYFGSGAFGLPTFDRLQHEHDLVAVVSQPARPAGRRKTLTPTPVAEHVRRTDLTVLTPMDPNDPILIRELDALRADAYVVIAYGHKLGEALLRDRFAINLHASLLPKYRGAAPINWAMIHDERETGVSVITLAQRMDAGDVLAQRRTAIDPGETAGELHDRLAMLSPDAVLEVLEAYADNALRPMPQNELLACPAPKLTKADGTVRFDQPANFVRARVHGLTPWPGCTIRIDDHALKLLRVQSDDAPVEAPPGSLFGEGRIACAPGSIRILSLQPPGGKAMTFDAYQRGHALPDAARCQPA